MEQSYWRKCGSCKKEIGYNTVYQVCSISSCSKMVFCSVDCWDMHNPVMNHKSSWSEENVSPAPPGRRIIIGKGATASSASPSSSASVTSSSKDIDEDDILIVASKLKNYIKNKFDMNTSASVMDVLSNQVRRITDMAAEKARRDGRKTLMDRDF